MRRAAFLIVGLGLLAANAAQVLARGTELWPEVTHTAKPWTRWWWPGSAVSESDLSRQLEMFAKAGLGGVEVTPIYGARGSEERDIPFLAKEWMHVLAHASREAARLDLGLDMATGTGWPFGGPNVVPFDNSQKMILKDGRLTGEPTNMKVKRAAPGGEGLVLDPYSTAALNRYLEPFTREFASFPRHHIRSQFHDSFEYYEAGWTAELPRVFREQHGYDIQAYAAELMGERPMATDQLARIKSDYRHTLARLHRDYLNAWVAWSHEHGFLARNQSHGAPANLLDLYGMVDIPETESFGSTAFSIAGLRRDPKDVRTDATPPHPLTHRMASSAANVMGRPLTSSETGTWLRENWKEFPAAMKPQVDQLFVTGVNHIFYHGTVYTPTTQSWPGWYFYASTQLSVTNPLWSEFSAMNGYIARVQSVLQSGSPDNEVLVYWPFADILDDPEGLMHQFQVEKAKWLLDSTFARTALSLESKGYAFDFISDDQLLQIKVDRGLLLTPGNHYRVIVIPATRRMPLATLTHLRTLAERGALVLFESLPEDVPGFGNLETRRNQFRNLLKTEAIQKAVVGNDLASALAKQNIAREPMVESGLHYVRRAQASGHDYFIVNLGPKPLAGWIELGRDARRAVLLDPLTGRAGTAALKDDSAGKTSVYLQLASGESILLRTHENRSAFEGVDAWSYLQLAGEPIEVRGEWTVSFIAGGPTLPQPLRIAELKSWTDLGSEGERFAGTARYRIDFDMPTQSADEWVLDLGDVRETARVRLNGTELPAAWSLPFDVRLGSLARGRNVLEIEVTNLAANRIRDMDKRGIKWRVMKEIDIVNIHYRPFDASQWEREPSGLLGPVVLMPMKRTQP